jgi:hypothetical protein
MNLIVEGVPPAHERLIENGATSQTPQKAPDHHWLGEKIIRVHLLIFASITSFCGVLPFRGDT